MPTLFENIGSTLEGNDLFERIAGQAGSLTSAIEALATFAAHPPTSVQDLIQGLGNVSLPEIDLGGFSDSVSVLAGAVPGDLSSMTGPLETAMGGLHGQLSSNIVEKMNAFLAAARAIRELSTTDFSSLFSEGTPSGKRGASTPPPGHSPPGKTETGSGSEPWERRTAAVNHVSDGLSKLPSPFNVPACIVFMRDQLKAMPRDLVHVRQIPYLDEFTHLLTTVVALREKDATGLRDHIRDTLEGLALFLKETGEKPLTLLTGELSSLLSQLETALLREKMDALINHLQRITANVNAGSLSGAGGDIEGAGAVLDTLMPKVSSLSADLFGGQVESVTRTFQRLPLSMDRSMRRVVQVAQPANQLKLMEGMALGLSGAIEASRPEAMTEEIRGFLTQAVKALDLLDASALRDPLRAAADGARSTVDGLDDLLSRAASQVAILFDQVDQALAHIDVTALTDSIEDAFREFGDGLKVQVANLFDPVREAISAGVTEIDTVISGFDPEDVIDALKKLLSDLTSVLAAPEVTEALGKIRQAIETAAQQIEALSFQPVTDQVVEGIGEVTTALKGVDPSQLNPALKIALNAAVAVLPKDLSPLTDPLVDEFGQLIETGPKPILQLIQKQPEKLLNQIRQYSPDQLIGDQLSKPFQRVIEELEKFKPSQLLQPVQEALDGFKDQLRQRVDPGQLLAPLEDLFNQCMAQFDKLKPGELIKPLEGIISDAIDQLIDALPVDEFLEIFDDLLARIEGVTGLARGIRSLVETITGMLNALEDPEGQLRTWLNSILALIDGMGDVSTLQPSFDRVAAGVNRLKASSLRAALESAILPLKAGLAQLGPRTSLNALSAAYRNIRREAVMALPDSAEKTALAALLDRFNPLDPDFARVFEGLEAWREDLSTHEAAFRSLLDHWDLRFHGPAGPLADFVRPAVTAEDLRGILQEAMEQEVIRPLGHMAGVLAVFSSAARGPLQEITLFIQELETKVESLLLGPDSLGGIRDTLDGLVQRLRDLDLQFLVRELQEVFDGVKARLQAVSPSAIRALVENTFNEALDLLDLSQLLPQTEIDRIDETYQKIIEDLKKLDPKKIIVEVVQPEFEEKVMPILETFDLSELMARVIEWVDRLDEELRDDLEEVDKAYGDMLNAVPAVSAGGGLGF